MHRVLGHIRRHPVWVTSIVIAVLAVGVGAFLNRDVIEVSLTADSPRDLTLPKVDPIAARTGETVYRIDAANSLVTVGVDEILAGKDRRVELTTQIIGGEVAVGPGAAPTDKPSVRFSNLVVNVGELRSDNSLRDKMLRHEFLETHNYPVVRLLDTAVTIPDGASSTGIKGAKLTGKLEVKGATYPTEWAVDANIVGDKMTVTAKTTVKMSDLKVGPISKIGLVRTSDKVDITVRVTAVDATKFTAPDELGAKPTVEPTSTGSGPSFKTDIAPILSENCASCHRRGQIGSSMWALDYASDAAEIADGLAVVTSAKYMPPWPASDLGVPLKYTRGLTDKQIKLISDWSKAGAKLDVPSDFKVAPPAKPEVRKLRADRVVKMSKPYKPEKQMLDEYRCFILDPKVTEPTYLTGYTFDPGSLKIVHHAIVTRVSAGYLRDLAEQEDEADPGPGWRCFTAMGGDIGDRVAGWVPGQQQIVMPKGTGYEMMPGDVLVAQIHYHYDPAAPADRSGMTLEFAKDPRKIVPLVTRTLIGPVELPCPAGSTGPLCDRKASLADIDKRFGPGSGRIADALHLSCGTTPEEVAARSDGITASTTCDFSVGEPGDIVGMLAHMHEIGSSFRMTLNPGTPDAKVLLDIPTWNFGWQLGYRPVDDISLKPTDVIRVTCAWDRRTRFSPTPRYIVFAEGTEDEMCFTSLTIRPPRY